MPRKGSQQKRLTKNGLRSRTKQENIQDLEDQNKQKTTKRKQQQEKRVLIRAVVSKLENLPNLSSYVFKEKRDNTKKTLALKK